MADETEEKTLEIVENEQLTYVFPKSEEMQIQRSDLQIQLEKFKRAILTRPSLVDLLAIVSLWSPTFTSDFKQFFGLQPEETRVGYLVFSIFITLIIFWSRLKLLFPIENVSSDAEKMSVKIWNNAEVNNDNSKTFFVWHCIGIFPKTHFKYWTRAYVGFPLPRICGNKVTKSSCLLLSLNCGNG